MESPLVPSKDILLHLSRTDPNPRVRHRAQGLLILCASPSQAQAARLLGTGAKQLRAWTTRFLAEGRDGLVDRPRSGRPPKLGPEAEAFLQRVVGELPADHGYPVATWTLADLTDLLARNGWVVAVTTVERHLHALGYRYRRPRHDLHHRQDAEAVATAKQTLAALQKRGPIAAAKRASSISTSAVCTPIRTWQRFGSGADRLNPFPPPGSIGGSPSSGHWSTDPDASSR